MGKILEKTTTYIVYIEKNSRKIPKKFPGIYYIYTI